MSAPDDRTRLTHIVQYCQKINEFLSGKDKEAFLENEMLQLAIIRLIEVVGEAGAQISDEFQEQHPEIPWAVIVAMRNRLIHAYFVINLHIVWDTATVSIPVLLKQVEELLKE